MQTHTDLPLDLTQLHTTSLDVHNIVEVRDSTRKVKDAEGSVEDRKLVELYFHFYSGAELAYRYFLFDTTAAEVIEDIERRIRCDLDYARTGAERLGPPDPVRLGAGGAENNQAVAEIVVADIDLYSTLRFSGRSGPSSAKALVSAPFTVDVPVSSIGVAATPLPSNSGHLVGQAGTVYVSRSADGTSLYLLGDDSAQAFGFAVDGIPK